MSSQNSRVAVNGCSDAPGGSTIGRIVTAGTPRRPWPVRFRHHAMGQRSAPPSGRRTERSLRSPAHQPLRSACANEGGPVPWAQAQMAFTLAFHIVPGPSPEPDTTSLEGAPHAMRDVDGDPRAVRSGSGELMAPRVLVVGGGFAGVGCARELARKHIDVTLIDQNDYHQFQPLLYQLATAQIAVTDIARPLRGIFAKSKQVRVVTGTVTGVDTSTRTVSMEDGPDINGDVLVLAAGAQPNFFDTPGAAQHAFPLYSVDDAERLRSRLLG